LERIDPLIIEMHKQIDDGFPGGDENEYMQILS
jgi:hypothetical protein